MGSEAAGTPPHMAGGVYGQGRRGPARSMRHEGQAAGRARRKHFYGSLPPQPPMGGLGEPVGLGHGVVAAHAAVDHMRDLDPGKARAAIAASWPGPARRGPGEAREAAGAARRKACAFHSAGGECAHTVFEPRVEPFAVAPGRAAGLAPDGSAAFLAALVVLLWLACESAGSGGGAG